MRIGSRRLSPVPILDYPVSAAASPRVIELNAPVLAFVFPEPKQLAIQAPTSAPWGSMMEKRFPSAREAVLSGLTVINPVSIARNAEYAFYVFKDGDSFKVGPLRIGEVGAYTNNGLEIPSTLDEPPVAIAHTHGASVTDRAGCAQCINTERLSGPDRNFATKFQLPIYVATPGGTFGAFDPSTNRSVYVPNVMPTH